LSFTFTNPGGTSPDSDEITANVALARGLNQGLFNAAKESSWTDDSPLDTQWATNLNNPGKTISAANFADLEFDTWLEAYGGLGQVGSRIVGRDAVLHLVSDDIYLDIRFTSWQQRSGGAFTYMRAVAPVGPMPTGDYNGNGEVDAADYVVWRDTLSQMVMPVGSGADGDASGTVDTADYEFWRARFGNTVPAMTSGLGLIAVPEPSALILALVSLGILVGCRTTRPRGYIPVPPRAPLGSHIWKVHALTRLLLRPGGDQPLGGLVRRCGAFDDPGDLVGTHAALDHIAL
jgi:hypothetical protein